MKSRGKRFEYLAGLLSLVNCLFLVAGMHAIHPAIHAHGAGFALHQTGEAHFYHSSHASDVSHTFRNPEETHHCPVCDFLAHFQLLADYKIRSYPISDLPEGLAFLDASGRIVSRFSAISARAPPLMPAVGISLPA